MTNLMKINSFFKDEEFKEKKQVKDNTEAVDIYFQSLFWRYQDQETTLSVEDRFDEAFSKLNCSVEETDASDSGDVIKDLNVLNPHLYPLLMYRDPQLLKRSTCPLLSPIPEEDCIEELDEKYSSESPEEYIKNLEKDDSGFWDLHEDPKKNSREARPRKVLTSFLEYTEFPKEYREIIVHHFLARETAV
jgi:hypothetical protein